MQAYWMWYWGDYEIYHTYIMSNRRQEFGADYPTLWHGETAYPNVEFHLTAETDRPGYLTLHVNGKGYLLVDYHRYADGVRVEIGPGKHTVVVRVTKDGGLPAAYVDSDVLPSGDGWLCTHMTAEKMPVGWRPVYDSPAMSPEQFPFSYEKVNPVKKESVQNEKSADGVLFDFGKELFGYVDINGLQPENQYGVFYGESREEALADKDALLFEYVEGEISVRLTQRAFRYIFVTGSDPEQISLSAAYEYLPLKQRGTFRCDNEMFNRVWEMCRYTFHLNCRETYLDGIKRDRWPWSGDAYQSYAINRYLYMDRDIDQRTTVGLRGKDPVEQHINTILDYSLYWIIALEDYHMTYGDETFLKLIWKRVKTQYEFVSTRENEQGFLVGQPGDWTFIDWSEIDKTGAVCAEQMLYIRALRAMAYLAELAGESSAAYLEKADTLISRINSFYWDEEKGAYIDSYESGRRNVTRHANIFALLFDIADASQRESIIQNVLLSDSVRKITTPYFEGFELDAMCRIGNFGFFEDMLTSYWGGMLELGATTVWEQFDPTKNGAEHYAMYGSRFSKSLCHAWGSTPVYLLGRYYLGVYATAPGYKSFRVEPQLGGLGEIEGTVPVGEGDVYVHLTKSALTVKADIAGGTLLWQGREYALPAGEEFRLEY